MFTHTNLLIGGFAFIILNIILPLAMSCVWLLVKIPRPLERLLRKCFNW